MDPQKNFRIFRKKLLTNRAGCVILIKLLRAAGTKPKIPLEKTKKVLDKRERMWYSKSPLNPVGESGNAPCELNNVSEKAPEKTGRAFVAKATKKFF